MTAVAGMAGTGRTPQTRRVPCALARGPARCRGPGCPQGSGQRNPNGVPPASGMAAASFPARRPRSPVGSDFAPPSRSNCAPIAPLSRPHWAVIAPLLRSPFSRNYGLIAPYCASIAPLIAPPLSRYRAPIALPLCPHRASIAPPRRFCRALGVCVPAIGYVMAGMFQRAAGPGFVIFASPFFCSSSKVLLT